MGKGNLKDGVRSGYGNFELFIGEYNVSATGHWRLSKTVELC